MSDKPKTRADKIAWLRQQRAAGFYGCIPHSQAIRIVDTLTPTEPSRDQIIDAIVKGHRRYVASADPSTAPREEWLADAFQELLAKHGWQPNREDDDD